MVFGFTENGQVCARQKRVLILQFIDTLKSVANPLCSCLSCSLNIPSLVSGKRLCFRASSVAVKVVLRVSGRVFKLLCLRIFLGLHILVIPRSNLIANEDYTFRNNRGGIFICVVIRVVLYFFWNSRLGNTQRTEAVFSYGLLPFISHTRLSIELLLFLPLLSCGENLALRRKANEDTGDRGKVFVGGIRVVYRIPGFSDSKKISKNEACSYFLVWPPSIFQACGSLYSNRSLQGCTRVFSNGQA